MSAAIFALRLPAQQTTAGALGNAQMQKARSARFLAQRGIGGAPGGASRYRRSPAQMLAEARAERSRMAKQRAGLKSNSQPSAASTSLVAAWQPVGPAQVITPFYGAVTGRITSIAADPADATGNTIYVGTTGGGVWKSTNAAGNAASVTFAPPSTDEVFDGAVSAGCTAATPASAVSLSIGAVSVQPGGTGGVLAGTGDPNDASDSYYGAGILRSTDNGRTWCPITQTATPTDGGAGIFQFFGSAFAGFAWSTKTPNLVVAAVSQAAEGLEVNAGSNSDSMMGIYYSQDAGATWLMATIEDSTDGSQIVQSDRTPFATRGNAVTSIVWNPVRQMFYAAVRFHGYYQSPDGVTWLRMPNQPGANLAATAQFCPSNTGSTGSQSCPIFRGALAVQPLTGDMFALTVDQSNHDQGLWQDQCALSSGQCSSPTVTFANQIADGPIDTGIANPNPTIPQADYNLYLAAVPVQQDTLLIAGTPDIYACSLANACAWNNLTQTNNPNFGAGVAPAQHAIDATIPMITGGNSCLLFFGNDGGLWRSTNALGLGSGCTGGSGQNFDNLNGGLGSLAEVQDFAQDASNAQNMMVSLGALGTAAQQGATATAWPQVLDGEGNHAAIDPATPQNWYATSLFGAGINLCTQGSSCNGANFNQTVIGNTQVSGDESDPAIPASWILDPQNTANVILGTCRVWRGPGTGGAGWSPANILSPMLDGDPGPFCNNNAEIRSLAASGSPTDPPGTPERIYAGMAGLLDGGGDIVPGHLFTASVTSTGGVASWTDLSLNLNTFNPGGFDVSSIYVDPHDPSGQTVYATIQGFDDNNIGTSEVYLSTDAGAIWTSVTSNLLRVPVNSIVVDPNDANTVYVATDVGVFVTTDISSCTSTFGSCWNVFGTSLPDAPVLKLATFNEASTSVLRAATYGRGMWQIPLATAGIVRTTASAVPANLPFSSQQLQTVSAPQTVTVTNTGSITFATTSVTVTGDFTETDNCSGQSVLPSGTCLVQVSFAPTQTGARTGTLTVFGNIPGGQLTVALSGTGVPGSAVVLTPATLSFPATLVGLTTTAQDITISNTGGVAATLGSESVSGDFAISANTCGSSLSPNFGCTLSITFAPKASGNRTGMLTVTGSAGTQTAQLSGIGQAPATDTLSPLTLSFAAQVVNTASATQQVTLTNSGDQALQLINTTVTGDFNAANNCGSSLAGHSSCAISVAFLPTQIGTENGTLTVSDVLTQVVNGAAASAQHSQTVALSGVGLPPPGVSATPSALNFGNYALGGTSPPQVVTLTNNGGVTLTGLQSTVNGGDFAIQAGPNACGATLAVGAACQIDVVFTPTQAGARVGSLVTTAANVAAPLTVALTGSGEDFTLQVSGSSSAVITSGQTATFQLQIASVNGSSGTVQLTCGGAPANASCTVNPTTDPFTGISTASATVTLTTGITATPASSQMFYPGGLKRLVLTLAMLAPIGWVARKRRWRGLALLGILAFLLPVGCSLGVTTNKSTSGSQPTLPGNPTPSGIYPLTVTGTAPGLSHSVTVTVTVE